MMSSRKKELTGIALLLLGAMIWGAAFTAQTVGAKYVPPFTFLASRTWLAIAVLFPIMRITDRRNKGAKGEPGSVIDRRNAGAQGEPGSVIDRRNAGAQEEPGSDITGDGKESSAGAGGLKGNGHGESGKNPSRREIGKSPLRKEMFLGGLLCGFFLFTASAAQQTGIAYTTTAKSGFITAMYVVIVPIIYAVIRRKSSLRIWISVLFAVSGLYLLCMKESFTLGFGDLITLLCAFLFSIQIMCVDRFVGRIGAVKLTLFEFLFEGVFATVCAALFENPTKEGLIKAGFAILYAGVMSSAVGYTLQMAGQARVNPAAASIAMSMESVFSALTGWIVLGQSLTVREIAGCAVMFTAIIIAEMPVRERKKVPEPDGA